MSDFIKIEDARPGDIAFWERDMFPFLLHGTVTDTRPGDDWPYRGVETREYGKGNWIECSFILPAKKAAQLIDELAKLEAVHRAALDFVHRGSNGALATLKAEWDLP